MKKLEFLSMMIDMYTTDLFQTHPCEIEDTPMHHTETEFHFLFFKFFQKQFFYFSLKIIFFKQCANEDDSVTHVFSDC